MSSVMNRTIKKHYRTKVSDVFVPARTASCEQMQQERILLGVVISHGVGWGQETKVEERTNFVMQVSFCYKLNGLEGNGRGSSTYIKIEWLGGNERDLIFINLLPHIFPSTAEPQIGCNLIDKSWLVVVQPGVGQESSLTRFFGDALTSALDGVPNWLS